MTAGLYHADHDGLSFDEVRMRDSQRNTSAAAPGPGLHKAIATNPQMSTKFTSNDAFAT